MQDFYVWSEHFESGEVCMMYAPSFNQPDDSKIFRVLRWDGGYRGIEQQFHFLSYGRLH